MVTTGILSHDLLVMTIDDGARPARRRMSTGLQPPSAEMSGSRHIRSSFHPASRWEVSSGSLSMDRWMDHKFCGCAYCCVRPFWNAPRHKKTTHPLVRRFALSTTVSTADVVRLPNGAEFCIRAVISIMLARGKCCEDELHICGLVDIHDIDIC